METRAILIEAIHVPEDERAPHIVESPIWEQVIAPGLTQFGQAFPSVMAAGHLDAVYTVLNDLFQSIYVLGYREGAKQKPALTFFCPEEPTDDQP